MVSEHAIIFNSDNIIGVIDIIIPQMQKNFQFNPSLMLELLLISDDFYCNDFLGFVVETFQRLSK